MTGTDLEDSSGEHDDRSDVPPAVRSALVQVASDALGTFDAVEVPASLRAVHRFAPRRRATAGAGPLWTALVHEDRFRSSVARVWAQANPELAARVTEPDASPSVPAATGAWLLGSPGWRGLVPPDAPPKDDVDGQRLRAGLVRAQADADQPRADLSIATEDARAAREHLAALQRELPPLPSDP